MDLIIFAWLALTISLYRSERGCQYERQEIKDKWSRQCDVTDGQLRGWKQHHQFVAIYCRINQSLLLYCILTVYKLEKNVLKQTHKINLSFISMTSIFTLVILACSVASGYFLEPIRLPIQYLSHRIASHLGK